MIRDGMGTELKPGNLIQVMLGTQPVRGRITGLRDGGMTVLVAKGQPQGVTPDIVIIALEIACVDAPPGGNHGTIIRLCDPETEHIVPKGN